MEHLVVNVQELVSLDDMRVGFLGLPSVIEGSCLLLMDFRDLGSDAHQQVAIGHVHAAEYLLHVVGFDLGILQGEEFVNPVKCLGATFLDDVSGPSFFHTESSVVERFVSVLQAPIEVPHFQHIRFLK